MDMLIIGGLPSAFWRPDNLWRVPNNALFGFCINWIVQGGGINGVGDCVG